MPISWEVDELVRKISRGEISEKNYTVKKLLENFDVKCRDIQEIVRISNWLNDRGVKCEPDLLSANFNAEIKLLQFSQTEERNKAKKMLLLSLLPCANINTKSLYTFKESEKMSVVVTAMKVNNLEYALVISDKINNGKLKPTGFITIRSILIYLSRLQLVPESDKDKFIANEFQIKDFFESNTTEPLIELIDKLKNNIKQNLVIYNNRDEVVGLANYAQIMLELYPYSKPFFVVSLIESTLSQIIRDLNFPKDKIANAVLGIGDNHDKRREVAEPEWLTMYEKIQLLHPDKLVEIQCNQQLVTTFSVIHNDLIRVNEIRNIIAHYRPDPISEEDLNLIYTTQQKLKEINI